MRRHHLLAICAVAAVVVTAGCGGSDDDAGSSAASGPQPIKLSKRLGETRGPAGEKPTPASALKLTDADIAKLKQGHHTAALAWHTSSDFVTAATAGARDEFKRLGIDVVAMTDARFDAAAQADNIETIMATKPDVIISQTVDPVSGAQAFRPAVDAGTKLVFLSNVPKGYRYGKEYSSIVTDDLFGMGQRAADALAAQIGGKGKIGYIFNDADNYVTNQRDQAFKKTIEGNYPGIQIAAEQGISDPGAGEEVGNAMFTKNPDLDGVYVSWAEPAEGVLSALRNNGNTTTKLVTLDLSEPLGVDLVRGGNTVAVIADETYGLGVAMADASALAILGKKAPPLVTVGSVIVTKDNVTEGWRKSLHHDPPEAVTNAAG